MLSLYADRIEHELNQNSFNTEENQIGISDKNKRLLQPLALPINIWITYGIRTGQLGNAQVKIYEQVVCV